ncbi:hypothetical protein FQR65_LT06447 [Abscondita terminalis]|nr:hypothetical protein FQR65_LT06447 [Abscondita terminalis]
MMFYKLSAIFLIVQVTAKSSVDYRLARQIPSGSQLCERLTFNGYTCKNCTAVAYCYNSTSHETIVGSCPNNKLCVNGRCVAASRCPFPDVPFRCTTAGMFPDPGTCTKYHICVKMYDNHIEDFEIPCEGNDYVPKYGFNPERHACSDVLPSNGQCQDYYVPVCENVFDVGVIPGTSIYYECSYYINDYGEIDLTILYPYQKRCDNGKVYNIYAGECM